MGMVVWGTESRLPRRLQAGLDELGAVEFREEGVRPSLGLGEM